MSNMRCCSKGMAFAAFGIGILLSFLIPDKVMLVILAVMLVVLGIITSKR